MPSSPPQHETGTGTTISRCSTRPSCVSSPFLFLSLQRVPQSSKVYAAFISGRFGSPVGGAWSLSIVRRCATTASRTPSRKACNFVVSCRACVCVLHARRRTALRMRRPEEVCVRVGGQSILRNPLASNLRHLTMFANDLLRSMPKQSSNPFANQLFFLCFLFLYCSTTQPAPHLDK